MKIAKNTSAFDTRWLRSVFCKTHDRMSVYEGRCRAWERLNVTVRGGSDRKWREGSGHAYIGTGPIVMTIREDITTRRLVALFWHEMMHVYGYRSHRSGQCNAKPADLDRICKGLPEKPILKQPKAKKPKDIIETRYKRILARQVEWEKKLRRAQAAVKKVQHERREYERRHNGRLAA